MAAQRAARVAWALATTALLWLQPAQAAAPESPVFVVEFAGDDRPEDRAHLLALLSLELGTQLIEVVAGRAELPVDRPALLVRIVYVGSSEGEQGAWRVQLVSRAVEPRVERRIDVGDLPAASQPRGLALAIAELVRTSQRPPPPAPPEAAPVPPPPPKAIEGPPIPRSVGLGIGVGARSFPTLGAVFVDPRLSLGVLPRRTLFLDVDAGVLVTRAGDALGNVQVWVPTVGLSGGLALELGSWSLQIGPRIELGAAVASGAAGSATALGVSTTAVALDLSMTGLARLSVSSRGWLALGLEAGYGVAGLEARADGRRVTGIGGPMLGLCLQLGLDLGG